MNDLIHVLISLGVIAVVALIVLAMLAASPSSRQQQASFDERRRHLVKSAQEEALHAEAMNILTDIRDQYRTSRPLPPRTGGVRRPPSPRGRAQ